MERKVWKSIEKKLFNQINKYDIAAVCLGVCLTIFFLITARYGVGMPDEAFYYTIPQRLLNGDRLFVDEWHLTQLASLFSVLPYWLFTTITGSTEGLILYMRLFFTGINMLFYCYLYRKLRSYGIWGLISSFLFCAILPEVNYAISYFTVSAMAITVVCIILFIEPNPGSYKCIAAGVFFALAVVAEPLLFFLYIIYTAAVILCRCINKKQAGIHQAFLEFRTWFSFSLGGFSVLAVLIIFLFATGVLPELPKTLPYLFTGTEFNADNFFEPFRLLSAYRFFGTVSLTFFSVCIVIFLFFTVFKKKSARVRILIFVLSCVSYAVSCFMGLYSVFKGMQGSAISYFVLYHDFPILLIVPIWYFLCDKKDSRLLAFWACGALYSLAVDISSDVVIGSGGRIAQMAGFLVLSELIPEITEAIRTKDQEKAKKNIQFSVNKIVFSSFSIITLLVFTVWNGLFLWVEGFYKPAEKVYGDNGGAPYSVTLVAGPFKNLKTNVRISKVYTSTLQDLDEIRREAHKESFITVGLNPYAYLYTDLPYACFSAWDQNPLERTLAYWKLHENRKPGYIYISFYPFMYLKSPLPQEDNIKLLETWFAECEVSKGKAGYTIKVPVADSLAQTDRTTP